VVTAAPAKLASRKPEFPAPASAAKLPQLAMLAEIRADWRAPA